MNSTFRAAKAVAGARGRLLMQYRSAALFGIATQMFWGMVRAAVFTAFYQAGRHTASLTLPQTIAYIWLVQATLAMMPWRTDPEIQEMVRSGAISYEALRPADLYSIWYARALAGHAIPTLMRGIPLLLAAFLLFHLLPPHGAAACALWLFSLFCTLLLAAAFTTLLNVSLLYTLAGDGVQRLMPALANAFSGMLIPLALLPRSLCLLLRLLPFAGLIDTPMRCYLGQISEGSALTALMLPIVWAAALIFAGRMLLLHALQKMMIQGG